MQPAKDGAWDWQSAPSGIARADKWDGGWDGMMVVVLCSCARGNLGDRDEGLRRDTGAWGGTRTSHPSIYYTPDDNANFVL